MNESKTQKHNGHILACLSSSPSNAKIIKTAAQMARAFESKFTAIYVKTPKSENMSRENKERLLANIHLAETLGAEIATLYGEDVAQQITEFARLSSVSRIVLGRSNVVGGRLFSRQTLTDKLIKDAPEIDIHIIPDNDVKKSYGLLAAAKPPSLKQIAYMFLILIASTSMGFLFHTLEFTEANTITVYMLGVLITALVTKNYFCSAVFSLASVLLFNFFFTEPRLTFIAYDSGYPVTFVFMLLASLITGTLANRVADSARLSANAAFRTNIMLETNRLIQKTETEDAVLETMARQLCKLLSCNVVIYPIKKSGLTEPILFKSENLESDLLLSEREQKCAERFYEMCSDPSAEKGLFKESSALYLTVKNDVSPLCIVGIEVGTRNIEHFENSIMLSILGEAALAVEKIRNAKEKEEISLLAKNEQLRADLLRTISHDLRTPLTSISGNTENLLKNYDSIDKKTRHTLLSDIGDDAQWLISLVENLLSISRISEGRMNINISSQLADEVVTEALKHISRKTNGHIIKTDFDDGLLLAKMDARLIMQVIINLVDNAIKYTPKGSIITVTVKNIGQKIEISICDNGKGIPDEHKEDVFKMFYTGDNTSFDSRRSLGLGLSLCKSIIKAHNEKLTLEDNVPCGCIFKFSLEKSEVKLGE